MATKQIAPESATPETATVNELAATSTVNREFQRYMDLVDPTGRFEAFVPWKKEGSTKPTAEVKMIRDNHWTIKANGSTVELMRQAMVNAAAKYLQRAVNHIETGPIPEELTDQCAVLFNSIRTPDADAKLSAAMEFLIANAPEEQPSTLLTLICRNGKREAKVKIASQGESAAANLDAFLSMLKAGTRVAVYDHKNRKNADKGETPIDAFRAATVEVEPAEALAS